MAHLKRLTAPKTWKVKRKGIKYITKPNPGPHKLKFCMPLNIVLRDKLGYAKTSKEVKQILINQEILVDGRRRKEGKFPLGFMDVLQIPKLNESYRMFLNNKGFLVLNKVSKNEAKLRPCKIINKTKLKGGRTQINMRNGINIIVKKDVYKCGETLILEMPKQTISEHIKFEKGSYILLMGGKHIGDHGVVEEIEKDRVYFKTKAGEQLETLKDHVLVVGKQKPSIAMLS